MKLYIWEGNGISDAYHDDGTLVVLAESPEQARDIVRSGAFYSEAWDAERDAYLAELGAAGEGTNHWTTTERGAEIWSRVRFDSDWFDGEDAALDRDPDRVVELDKPAWVAFNGGGYD